MRNIVFDFIWMQTDGLREKERKEYTGVAYFRRRSLSVIYGSRVACLPMLLVLEIVSCLLTRRFEVRFERRYFQYADTSTESVQFQSQSVFNI
ncbi:hypothetical protein CEXT_370311 [Caerostris extrusa]|uniref:Uncharacterized protein n=1 Tax=Caerostris extrusa TaxID=172846 RepID=A0AAV4NG07_CAEEX|nr:hypothetical protein CEXT_370311 [Caerostris extrusa]